jgi:hypothetical protein
MNDTQKMVKFLRKFFSTPIEFEGFVFEFTEIKVEKDFVGAYKFVVNVILPNPNQSYITQVFNNMITGMIYQSFNFIGQTYSYSLTITIDGKELFESTYTFIKKESLQEIIQRSNEEFKRIGVNVDFGKGDKSLNMDCRLSWDKIPYEESGENVNFYLKLELSNFELDGRYVIPNPKKKNIVAGTLHSILVDRDWFVSRIDDIIYEEIIPETKIDKVDDVYANTTFRVNRLNGELVKQEDRFYIIQIDDFIEVS